MKTSSFWFGIAMVCFSLESLSGGGCSLILAVISIFTEDKRP